MTTGKGKMDSERRHTARDGAGEGRKATKIGKQAGDSMQHGRKGGRGRPPPARAARCHRTSTR